MKSIHLSLLFIILIFSGTNKFLYAQATDSSCKVLDTHLAGTYKGDCKNGFADGQGDAKGLHHYTGTFKNGMPNGNGTYYYNDSTYYSGNFQDGIKEGKGETHYNTYRGGTDSVVKGYWSGDKYRGKRYVTYNFDAGSKFDRVEIIPSDRGGNLITFELSSTSGVPSGSTSPGVPGFVLSLVNLFSTDKSIVSFQTKFESGNTSTFTFQLSHFPISLHGILSNGEDFNLQLYKCADWKVRLYVNK
jgi:hypothetical protein